MNLDDSFTEKLIQRNKARKEYINEKRPDIYSSTGKKRPALDEQPINCGYGSADVSAEESPKRQCTQAIQSAYSPQDKENNQMEDEDPNAAFVPYHSASKARGLAALKKNFVDDGDDEEPKMKVASVSQVNKSSTYVFSTNSNDLCSGKKSRFANLAEDIKQWEDNTHKPTLSSNNVTCSNTSKPPLSPTYTPNSTSKSNTFSMKLYYSNKSTDTVNTGMHDELGSRESSTPSASMSDKGGLAVGSSKKGNIGVGSGAGIHGRMQAWNQAVAATLDTPATAKYPAKSPVKTSGKIMKLDSNLRKESSAEDECSDDESIDENDFAENYGEISSEPENVKMELDYSPIKPVKRNENLNVEIKPEIVSKPVASAIEEPIRSNVDPAELPLSARKALFEKALLGGTPKLNEVIDNKLSVAQRTAMFENASKVKTRAVNNTVHFKEPKRIALSNFSKFDKTNSNQMVKSPVKAVQPSNSQTTKSIAEAFQARNNQVAKCPVKGFQEATFQAGNQVAKSPVKTLQELNSHLIKSPAKTNHVISKGSPAKNVISTPVTSTPSPIKNIGNHTRFIQQKLIENSGSSLQGKEIAAKAAEERKQEISGLVNHWEKLSSSSSVENNSEVERNHLASEEKISSESDAVPEPSEYGEESNSDDASEEEYEDERDEEKDADCSDLESEEAENVFEMQDSEIESLKSLEEDCNSEPISWQREDTQSMSSLNARSAISSLSGYSGISSYSDDSNYNASRSQSGASDSSARSYEVGSSSATTGTPVNSMDSKNPEVSLLRTISIYRKQQQETRLTPVRTIVHHEKVNSPNSPGADYTEIIQERIKALQEEILRQQTVISQTSQALNLCSATAEFSGSTEQVEGERLLLIATQKRHAFMNEISRFKTCGAQGENVTDGKGTLIITDIQLPLKREFMASQLEGKGTDTVHYFLCLIRHGAQVIVTQMMSTTDKVSDGALCFTNHIKLQNLPADFSVVFEVYALQTKKDDIPHEKKYHIKREHSKMRLTPKGRKGDSKILMPAISSPGGPNAVRSPSFGVVGYSRFNLQNCNKKTFTLDQVPFTSPLDGVLRVKLQLHAEHKVIEKGFLTMFEDVSGFGAWHRRWCALDSHHLAYWKYPDDEHKKEPIGIIDLKQCVTGQVKLVPRDVCARPHTFQLVTVRPQAKGDKNTLISRSMNTLTTTKHLLSADTKDERILWCNKLNEALSNGRKWDPQALRPVESMQD